MSQKTIDLERVREYFDQRADAEYFTDRAAPVGNEAMSLLGDVDAAIAAYTELSRENAELRVELRRVKQFSGDHGLSTDGCNVFGNAESIKRVWRWMHDAGNLSEVSRQLLAERDTLRTQVAALQGEVERLRAKLTVIARCRKVKCAECTELAKGALARSDARNVEDGK